MHSGNRMTAAGRASCLVAALFAFAGCASMHAAETRKQYLLNELSAHEYQQDIDTVWVAALRLLAERGFPLSGKDRLAVDQKSDSILSSFLGDNSPVGGLFNKGSETFVLKDGRRIAVTDWRDAHVSTRYRVEGIPTGPNSCRIQFSSAEWSETDVLREPDPRNRDIDMELDLMSILEPEAAQKLAADAEAVSVGRAVAPTPAPEPTQTTEPAPEPAPTPEPAPPSP
jgi:hypothetical protein